MAKKRHLPSGPPPSQRKGPTAREKLPQGAALRAELRKLDQVVAAHPRHFVALSLRALYRGLADRWLDARHDVDTAVGLVPHGDAAELEILSLRAMVRRELGDLEGALADLNQLVILKVRPPVLAARGEVHRRLGDLAAARDDLDRSLESSPTDPFAYVARGRVHLAEGRPGAAIADFDEALRLDDDDVSAFHHRARARRSQGDHDGARADWETALQRSRRRLARDPLDTRAPTWIAWITAEELQVDLPGALALLEQVRPLLDDPDQRIDFLEPLGRIHYRLGHLEDALRLCERAHALCPLDVELRARLDEVRQAAGLPTTPPVRDGERPPEAGAAASG